MHFRIQEPRVGQLLYRIDAISSGAEIGVGVFAFASKSGIQALINSPNIQRLIAKGSFTLIVGVDALTNVEAIETLVELSDQYEGRLKSFVFLDSSGKGIFHPKFCWFKKEDTIHVLAGSGNLTSAGLGATIMGANNAFNWEAFGDFSLSGQAAQEFEENWDDWISSHRMAHRLRLLRDQDVIARAMQNSRFNWQVKPGPAAGQNDDEVEPEPHAELAMASDKSVPVVFISEIPSGKGRWNQANFRKDDFEDFFGFEARAGQDAEVVTQHVTASGEVGEVEIRRPVVVKSRNFRVELGAGRGVAYSTTELGDRPVVVFVRIDAMAFRYCLLMPGEQGYQEVLTILGPRSESGRILMRQTFVSIDYLKTQWSTVPLELLPSEEVLPEV
ncbi:MULTISPECIES: phospholipase D family protein [Halomonas]|uniref:phospholipase D family protein n=1 Tax=Halomonas TaxID=2745 RepID=UPI001C95CA2A|nr:MULTISPECIES: phospholipase D family protein [Halomonas]MBY6207475.1 phospholipase D family protein [Halomonas sp. DP3Y7-2]MBY6228284.1 phospholipase D family protein [Halomonas sp. DP3Y7-1]MCA0916349.1 phospholipase D family protein [Halomonas denitrificans]